MATQSQPRNQDKDEVYELIKSYQANPSHETAQTRLVEIYRPMVISLARKYSKGQNLHDDLVQVGMIGLLTALKRFDANFGKSFESFAVPTIIGEIKRYIRDKTWSVHVPRRIKELGPKIRKTVDHLTTELGRPPKVVEIADHLEVDEEQVLEAMEMTQSYRALSVDSTIEADAEGGTLTLLDVIGSPEDGYDQVDQQLIIDQFFAVLTETEREVLQSLFFDNLSQTETGEKLSISQMHVSRLRRRALDKLKEAMHTYAQEC